MDRIVRAAERRTLEPPYTPVEELMRDVARLGRVRK
jgi:hypothetical protein